VKEESEMIKEIARLKEELKNIKIVEKKLLNLITPEIVEKLINCNILAYLGYSFTKK